MKVLKMHLIDIAILALGSIVSFGFAFLIGEYFIFCLIFTLLLSILFKLININNYSETI